MLAIIRALEEWRHFLEGAEHQVKVWTDHKNLEYFMSAKKLNQRQARWSLLLARFDFLLHHWPGKTMGKLDALSQRSDHGSGSEDNQNLTLLTPSLFAVGALEWLLLRFLPYTCWTLSFLCLMTTWRWTATCGQHATKATFSFPIYLSFTFTFDRYRNMLLPARIIPLFITVTYIHF